MTSSISNILTPARTQMGAQCSSKKKLIQHISQFLASTIKDAQADDIYERLIAREKLGSTGIGEGIAIPHSRLEECEGTIGALFTLEEPIDYDSIDRKPVDIVFVLLVPAEATEQHLQTLSMLAEKFSQETFRDQLRSAKNHDELYQLATA
ncbi:PTS IIA-like nitrogen regulatory protein PtsN [Bermanella sp. WJH001]|uniref:PTS IIA-like nitrogen regulatory protein PtsN n=1 Tax=Bermanella sp. WJH001 TaxID=3048005 RepID=UPI0024BDB396|nr:PTS IIA-like nitrogen regulatory protein PtsN [Bermanella sp. WJH001]MDJ1537948.1 PTS IIA-like nitrogen regulatory protein PtsN [Bermanella sp. WJH001]